MIFNNREVVDVLRKYFYNTDLTNKDRITIQTLIYYLNHQEPKITFEEFNELFKVEKKLIDKQTVELDVIPKNKFYVRVEDGRLINDMMNVNAEIQEHIQGIAYSEFEKVLDNLKEKFE